MRSSAGLQAQRFVAIVLLPHVRKDIRENHRLHFALFQSLKKACYKPDAFYKVPGPTLQIPGATCTCRRRPSPLTSSEELPAGTGRLWLSRYCSSQKSSVSGLQLADAEVVSSRAVRVDRVWGTVHMDISAGASRRGAEFYWQRCTAMRCL